MAGLAQAASNSFCASWSPRGWPTREPRREMAPGGNDMKYFGATLRRRLVEVPGSLSWELTTGARCSLARHILVYSTVTVNLIPGMARPGIFSFLTPSAAHPISCSSTF